MCTNFNNCYLETSLESKLSPQFCLGGDKGAVWAMLPNLFAWLLFRPDACCLEVHPIPDVVSDGQQTARKIVVRERKVSTPLRHTITCLQLLMPRAYQGLQLRQTSKLCDDNGRGRVGGGRGGVKPSGGFERF